MPSLQRKSLAPVLIDSAAGGCRVDVWITTDGGCDIHTDLSSSKQNNFRTKKREKKGDRKISGEYLYQNIAVRVSL